VIRSGRPDDDFGDRLVGPSDLLVVLTGAPHNRRLDVDNQKGKTEPRRFPAPITASWFPSFDSAPGNDRLSVPAELPPDAAITRQSLAPISLFTSDYLNLSPSQRVLCSLSDFVGVASLNSLSTHVPGTTAGYQSCCVSGPDARLASAVTAISTDDRSRQPECSLQPRKGSTDSREKRRRLWRRHRSGWRGDVQDWRDTHFRERAVETHPVKGEDVSRLIEGAAAG
jgi:hypothetical protein